MALALAACKSSHRSPRAHAAGAAHDAGAGKLFVHASVRCSECHEKIRLEWVDSAHARAATSPLYVAMRAEAAADAPAQADDCDSCHAPLRRAVGEASTAAREGVTCDVCHAIDQVGAGPKRGTFHLELRDAVRFGPLCDAKDHYFHRMGCAPVFAQATLCAGCHFYVREVRGAELPVYTEYRDFGAGPTNSDGTTCQGCHMPATRAQVANGSPERDGVRGHGFLGKGGTLRQQAVELSAKVEANPLAAGGLAVTVRLENSGAGHRVPEGDPERRVAIRVRALDRTGSVVASQESELGRVLVDAGGAPAPFYRAVKVSADTRLAVGGTWQDHFVVPAPVGGKLEVVVLWRSHSAATAARLHVPVTELEMARAELALTGVVLPRTVKAP